MQFEGIKRTKRASEEQKEYLINHLEQNIDIANDKFISVDGAKAKEQMWNELAIELNSLGGTTKDGSKWRKYWNDLRLNTRSKHSTYKNQLQKSGVNGTQKIKELTELEQRVLNICSMEAVDGIPAIIELGFSTTEPLEDTEALEEGITYLLSENVENEGNLENIQISKPVPQSKNKRKRTTEDPPYAEAIIELEKKKVMAMEEGNKLKAEQNKIHSEIRDFLREIINLLSR